MGLFKKATQHMSSTTKTKEIERKPAVPKKGAAALRPATTAAAAHHRLRNFSRYNTYTRAILKQTHGDKLGMKGATPAVFNAIIRSLTCQLTAEAVRCKRAAGRTTLTSRDVRGAVLLAFPPELSRHVLNAVDAAVAEHERARKEAA